MAQVFALGPVPIDGGSAMMLGILKPDGKLDACAATDLTSALRELRRRHPDLPFELESELADLAAEQGLECVPVTPDVAVARAALAISLATRSSMLPGELTHLAKSVVALEHAKPWARFSSDEALVAELSIAGATQRYEVSIMGSYGETFGVSMMKFGEMTRTRREPSRNPSNARSMVLGSEPEYAATAFLQAFGTPRFPLFISVSAGKVEASSKDDALTLAVLGEAVVKLLEGGAFVEHEGVDSRSRRIHVRLHREYAYRKPEPVARKGERANEPCPCGSGKKYKKCHGARNSSAAPEPTLRVVAAEEPSEPMKLAHSFHAACGELALRCFKSCETRWPGWPTQQLARLSQAEPDLPTAFSIPWVISHVNTPDGQTPVEVLRQSKLTEVESATLAAIQDARLSVWESLSTREDESVELLDLLGNARRTVLDVSASRLLAEHPRAALLASVGPMPGSSKSRSFVLHVVHPRILDPASADEVLAQLKSTRTSESLRKIDPESAALLLELWRKAAMRAEETSEVVRNTDGEILRLSDDQFEILSNRAEVVEALLRIQGAEDVGEEPGQSIALTRGPSRTVIAQLRLTDTTLSAATNSLERADAVRALLNTQLGSAVAFVRRELNEEIPSVHRGARVDMQLVTLQGPADQESFLRDKMRAWLNTAHPELEGATPRQAVEAPRTRKKVHRMLREAEFLSGSEIAAWARAELALEPDGTRSKSIVARNMGTESKISETILDYVAPLLAAEGLSMADQIQALWLGVAIWNQEVWAELEVETPKSAPRPSPGVLESPLASRWVEPLRQRRRELFAGDYRIVGDVKAHSEGLAATCAPAAAFLEGIIDRIPTVEELGADQKPRERR